MGPSSNIPEYPNLKLQNPSLRQGVLQCFPLSVHLSRYQIHHQINRVAIYLVILWAKTLCKNILYGLNLNFVTLK